MAGERSVQQLEAKLHAITALVDEGSDRELIRLVEALVKRRSPAALGALLAHIRDDEHDMMELIMQATDRFPRKMFAAGFARELVAMHARAPYRTSIFVSRILQSRRGDFEALVAALLGAGPELQRALAEMFDRIADDRPDLRRRMNRVLRAVAARRTL